MELNIKLNRKRIN